MRLRIDNCYYELVKDLLLSQDSLVKSVQKDETGAIVTLQRGHSQTIITILQRFSRVYFIKTRFIF